MKYTPNDLRVSFTKVPRKAGSRFENVLMVALFVVTGLLWGPVSCRCSDPPPPPPVPVQPDATAPTPVPPPPPPKDPEWAVVGDLDAVKGHWGEGEGEEAGDGDWCEITSRADALAAKKKWGLPYPWRLQMKGFKDQPPWDCGFYERLEPMDDWRVGYCVGGDIEGNARSAHRIVLHTLPGQPPQLRVRIGSKVEVILNR